jgi:hypothetical protein
MPRTTKTAAQKIEDVAAKHADDNWTFYAAYSGRGMFGHACPGIVCPAADVPAVKKAVRGHGKPSVDNMGLDMIVYWVDVVVNTPNA